MIEHIIIGICWTWGVYAVFQTKYLLARLGKVIEQFIGTVLAKPLFRCPPCMSSFHGLILSFYFGLGTDTLIFMVSLLGANFILKEFLYYDEDIQQEK